MDMKEEDQEDISLIETQFKEAFTDDTFTAYRKLTMVRWAGEHVNVYANKIRQLAGLAGFKGAELEIHEAGFCHGFCHSDRASASAEYRNPDHGKPASESKSVNNWGPKPGCGHGYVLTLL